MKGSRIKFFFATFLPPSNTAQELRYSVPCGCKKDDDSKGVVALVATLYGKRDLVLLGARYQCLENRRVSVDRYRD
jgi:hypothetical protein